MLLICFKLLLVLAHGWQVALGLSPGLSLTCCESSKSGTWCFRLLVKGQKGQDLSELKDDGGMGQSGKHSRAPV